MSAMRILIVEARFYEEIADKLYQGASMVCEAAGAAVERLFVPGCFELPAAISFAVAAQSSAQRAYDGYVALGCVIRGETDHYEHICREVAHGLSQLGIVYSIPIGFGVLTCRSYEQAELRSDVEKRNYGADAARACLRMIQIKTMYKKSA